MLLNIASGLVSMGTGLISGAAQKSAANKASIAYARGTDTANRAALNALGAQSGMLSPYTQRGNAAGDQLNALLGLGTATYATAESEAADKAAEDAWAAQAIQAIRGQVKKGEAKRSRLALEATAGQSPSQQLAAMRAVLGTKGLGILGNLEATKPLPGTSVASTAPATGTADAQAAAEKAFETFRGGTGYQFNMSEGLKAVAQPFASAGAFQSGAAMKALQERGAGIADNTFNTYANLLGNQQQTGLSAANTMSGNYGNYGQTIGSNALGAAESAANNYLAQGMATANQWQSVGQGVNQMIGMGSGSTAGFNPFQSSYTPPKSGGTQGIVPGGSGITSNALNLKSLGWGG